jgi:ABC-type multidrug transport system fused ATPase/permease subunit
MMTPSEHRRAVTLLGLMLVGVTLETLGVGVVIPAITLLMEDDYAHRLGWLEWTLTAFGGVSHETVVIGAMVGLVAVFLFKTLFLTFLSWHQTRFAFSIQVRISEHLFAAYLRQPYALHLQRNSAELLRNITVEVEALRSNALLPSMVLLIEASVLLALCTLLLVVEPLGALVVVSALGIVAVSSYRLTRRGLSHWALARQRHEGLRVQHLQQGLGGAKEVKLLGRETEFVEQYRVHNTQSARAGQFNVTLQQLPRLWLELLAVIGLATLVLTLVMQGRKLSTVVPMVGLFAAVAFRLMPSANRLLASVQSLRFGFPVIDILHKELKVDAAAERDEHVTEIVPFRHTLALDEVTFSYAGAREPALNSLSLCIRRGESVGFIGASGAGKSTLVDILLGLLTPDTGYVRVDGVNIQTHLRNWQNQIGYVPQSIYLTDDTLRRNVAFGLPNPDIDEETVWRCIRAAQLDEFVQSLPNGLDSMVGERGVRLSGGQRQRIGIARALYHDPSVLVLDEATSALDTATERSVMQAVNALQGEKTILIVAHRVSTVEHCDRLYRLERGRIVHDDAPGFPLPAKQLAQSS